MVGAGDGRGGAAILEIDGEILQTHARDGEELREQGDLVLHVAGDGLRDAVVVGLGGAREERHGERRAGVGERDVEGGGRRANRGEVTGEAEIVGGLAGELQAGENLVTDGAGGEGDDEVGLIEEIVAVGGLVVGGEGDGGAGGIYGTGVNILVEFFVAAEARVIAQRDAVGERVIENGVGGVDGGAGGTLGGIAEEPGECGWHGATLK